MEKRHYITLVTDPALNNEVLVFSVRERDTKNARRALGRWYEDQGWPNEGLFIRLVSVRSNKDVQLIGHATDKEAFAIRALCEEVIHIANGQPVSHERLATLVRAFGIGEKVYQDHQEDEPSKVTVSALAMTAQERLLRELVSELVALLTDRDLLIEDSTDSWKDRKEQALAQAKSLLREEGA